MTLAIKMSALEQLVRPEEAVGDARAWTENVGVVADVAPDELESQVRAAGVEPDFVSGERGQAGTLAAIRQRFPTDRHVFVGTTNKDRETAEALGWEYTPIEEAAEKAEWGLVDRD